MSLNLRLNLAVLYCRVVYCCNILSRLINEEKVILHFYCCKDWKYHIHIYFIIQIQSRLFNDSNATTISPHPYIAVIFYHSAAYSPFRKLARYISTASDMPIEIESNSQLSPSRFCIEYLNINDWKSDLCNQFNSSLPSRIILKVIVRTPSKIFDKPLKLTLHKLYMVSQCFYRLVHFR